MNATNLKRELLAWANGDLNSTCPTQLSSDPNYGLLEDAIDFELGNYSRSDAAQRKLAVAAIRRFCTAADVRGEYA